MYKTHNYRILEGSWLEIERRVWAEPLHGLVGLIRLRHWPITATKKLPK